MIHVQRRDEVLEQALDVAADARPAFLDEACAGDQDLRQEVERLLAIDADGGGDFLDAGAVAHSTCAPGTVIDRYEIRGLIGVGGMGAVYRAHDPEIGRDVALKIMTRFRTSAERRRLAIAEVRALGRVRHDGIVHIYTVGEYHGRPFFVMELLEGRDLAAVIADPSAVPVAQKLDWLRQLADALRAVHAVGLVHRDVKPSNVFVTPDGRIKLLDFGIARPLDQTRSHATAVSGTPAYMAPEQQRGEPATPASDVYAFGVVLGELLAGRPTRGPSGTHVEPRLGALPATAALAQVVPPAIVELYSRMTAPDPAERIQRFDDVLRLLGEPPSGPSSSGARWTALVAVLAVVAALAGVAVWRTGTAPASTTAVPAESADPRVRLTLFTDAGVERPAVLTGQPLALGAKDRFGLQVSATEAGHLYLLAQSLDHGGVHILFPSATSYAGSSRLSSDAARRVPEESWFYFDERPGTERMWIVWSREPHRQFERASRWANERDRGEIKDAAERAALEALLAASSARPLAGGELRAEPGRDEALGFIDLRHD